MPEILRPAVRIRIERALEEADQTAEHQLDECSRSSSHLQSSLDAYLHTLRQAAELRDTLSEHARATLELAAEASGAFAVNPGVRPGEAANNGPGASPVERVMVPYALFQSVLHSVLDVADELGAGGYTQTGAAAILRRLIAEADPPSARGETAVRPT